VKSACIAAGWPYVLLLVGCILLFVCRVYCYSLAVCIVGWPCIIVVGWPCVIVFGWPCL
jgi:hypothetical protein